ncbi:bifunctional GTP diphosphokinase/guanosine-3',5'-bis pyrophosphate 3'-pyrophosphohydrolase [Methylotuvimicrobium alcaliphilum]|uniref:guanosine-3',5'-bis(diphosphate) 3'-diphosphatase n=1 Tax=Methylotuvimicrobium alcaliphilum (strain DSM 19304 / NCIMB 14124 / VKM B-2133 / 20Z) TaxID=1091494 RepID=G4SVX4_META2|nr:bifunctional GTP diphosphokinase/guanosine-3',5'-bis pyrophosphate 3'-pyrophosphohydrolase [Methylotuvimicrobium alcaliphilum]CCE25209.1 Guanosine-3',5'-bis(diphosphate) 3'-pyrophosphohydrolase ((ppGpp)ase) (Penta-phosphate guanosine-3'-pyrophosphohydrolase) [Methylotuvimicrobium alcaliphilum 20Z]
MLQLADSLELERPQDKLIRRLCSTLESYMDQNQINDICRAYQYGAEAHAGQFRKSGEAYICHPIAVAISLAEMRMDAKGIMAALLHDVIEDTHASKDDLGRLFSMEVAELVDGVTKLSKIDSKSRAEAQAENVRKMFLAMTKDLRVIMVKLADRLHNMQTLGSMPPEKKRRIARETLDIYAPIANRLGMNHIRHQLESLGFKALYPGRHAVLKNAVKKARGNRREIVEIIQNSIKNRLREAGLECEVEGREKNLYSIYQKMLNKKISFADVFDVYAFRILCDQPDTCYRVLGVVHNLYNPVPGRFKDYIALSKANGYQSLHTILIGPYGVPIEIQIRTHEMHRMSESGIAAHWLYKSDSDKAESDKTEHAQARANEWLRELLEIHKSAGNSMEFIDNLKIDLYPQEVFVFTPQGGIIKLPRGATIVDFAYAVHTDIGNSCVSARVDKQLVPLQTQLENGLTVEVITTSWARPNPLWLNYVVTAKARSSIRAYLKNFKQQEAINLGRRLLEKELQGMNLQLDTIPSERVNKLLEVLSVNSMDVLLEDIGLGNKMPFLVAKRLSQDDISSTVRLDDNEQGINSPLIIKGTEGMVVTLAKCCRPIPGDSIVGFFNPGRGIVVHHHECRNSSDSRKKQTGWLDVEWSKDTSGEFPAEIRIELLNQRGTLATIAATISEMDSNIENVTVVDQDDRVSVDLITLTVKDRVHLANIMRRLKKLTIVLKITRVKA